MVTANGFEHVSPLENLYANETIEHHDNENDKPREKKKSGVRLAGEKYQVRRDIPYGSIEENYAEEHPIGRDRTPKLSGTVCHPIDRTSLNLGKGTHCHTSIHRASLRGADEEEGYSRDEYKGSNYTNVLHLELAQSFSIVLIEDNKKDVASHGKCPEYICQRKPVRLIVNVGVSCLC
jgi:hypothetical protein